jgi:hypothetical protein
MVTWISGWPVRSPRYSTFSRRTPRWSQIDGA